MGFYMYKSILIDTTDTYVCAATVSQTLLMSFVSDINLAEIGNMASSSLQKKGGPLAQEFGPPRGSRMKEDPLNIQCDKSLQMESDSHRILSPEYVWNVKSTFLIFSHHFSMRCLGV